MTNAASNIGAFSLRIRKCVKYILFDDAQQVSDI